MIAHRVQRDLARAISAVENGILTGDGALARVRAAAGTNGTLRHADVIGVTGPPGAGKSTLVDRLIEGLRAAVNIKRAAGEPNAVRAVRFEIVRRARDRAAAAALAVLDSAEGAAVLARLREHDLSRSDAVDALLAILEGAVHAD